MTSYSITTIRPGVERLAASAKLSNAEFQQIASSMSVVPLNAKKTGIVAACVARQQMVVETVWESESTSSTAKVGDWIVTSLDRRGGYLLDSLERRNVYVIPSERFPHLYKRIPGENSGNPLFEARDERTVQAIAFEGGIDIIAPWGSRQVMDRGYLVSNGTEVYGNEARSFLETYTLLN